MRDTVLRRCVLGLALALLAFGSAARSVARTAEAAGPEGSPSLDTTLRAAEADSIVTTTPAPGADERDVLDLFKLRRGPRKEPKQGELMRFLLPVFSVNPTSGVSLGVGLSAAIALGPPSDTIVSSMSGSVMVTTKKQLTSNLKTVLVTPGNTWELLGDLRFNLFSEPTYGLSTGPTPVSGGFQMNGVDTEALPGAQPMKFDYTRVHETVFRRVSGPFYLGVGYHLDLHTNIEDERLNLAAVPPAVTSHYAYSVFEGFDDTHYSLSGLSLNALWETRDHTLNPYRGVYLQLGVRVNPTWLGSSRPSSSVYGELRTYLPVSKTRPRHLVAFWVRTDAVATGEAPYLDLPAIGYDTRGRTGRGYAAGRFRGTALVYGEAEYRFPLTKSGILGGVVFLNATTTSRPAVVEPALGVSDGGVALFHSVVPAGGAGLRVMGGRQARMNFVLDYAFGVGGAHGFYLALGEAF